MINFFRKKRKSMADDNKVLKYTRYAIGEIVLVVIGILIALQINTWNQKQKDLKKELQIIESFHHEFTQNKDLNLALHKSVNESISACNSLLEISLKGDTHKMAKHMDSLIYWSIEYKPFIPNNNTYTEILNTGEIELLKNETIKNAIFEYYREVENNKATYIMLQKWIEEGILPYLADHISIRNIDNYGLLNWKEKSRFEDGIKNLIDDRKFENIIDNNIYHLTRLKEEYENLNRITDTIIKHTTIK